MIELFSLVTLPKKIQNPKGGPLASNDFVSSLNILGDPFVTLKNYSRNVISGSRYILFALNAVWVALLLKGTPLQLKFIM